MSIIARRKVMTVLAGAAALPIAARGQQQAMRLVGYLSINPVGADTVRVVALREGLSETGYVEGKNIAIEYRYGANQYDRLPALAADLVRRKPAVVFTIGPPSVRAVQAQSATIPIVFFMGEDPVKEGLVASLNRPGGNITGFGGFTNQLFAKRLQLLNEIVPKPAPLALLVNPDNPNAEPDSRDAQTAAVALGRELRILSASNERGIEEAFAALVQSRAGGLMVGVDGIFVNRMDQIFALAARHAIPAIYEKREYPERGGLMSYGTLDRENFRQCGIYVGRVLRGEKPADLPVLQATKFEFVINLRIAKFLGLDIPSGVLAIADEVIE
jgi:putative ABC transport system substrate-binding protein